MPTCSYEGCDREVYRGGEKCIFHAEEKDPQEFRNALARQIRTWRSEKAGTWNFRGWVFVDVERKRKDRRQRFNLFSRAVFPVAVDFTGATFAGAPNFSRATFKGAANFYSTTFAGDAYFSGATFSEDANFYSTTFTWTASFSSATFCSALNMSYTCFAILGDFGKVTIGGKVKLTWPGEGHNAQEKGAEIKRGRLLLRALKFEKHKGEEEPLLDLRGNRLQEDCKLAIHDTNLSNVLLEGTDCRLIEFYNVTWREEKRRRHAKRRIVADEHYLRTDPGKFGDDKPSWKEIEITYQQLADRFRKDLDHPSANDFERGIFEARLEAAKANKDWRNRFLLEIYKFASDFSGSIMRPVVWTLLLTAVAAVIYGGLLYDGFCNVSLRPGWDMILDSIVASLRVVSLDRRWLSMAVDASHVGPLARFILTIVAVVQTLMTATLVTLFIFSVRRRFKHTE